MPFTPASPLSVAAFVAILVAVVGLLLWGLYRAYGHVRAPLTAAALLAAWLGLLSAVILSGRMPYLPLNGLPFFFGSVLILAVGFGLSPVGGVLAARLPVAALIGFQAFRFPLELVLHQWAREGTIPGTMTWTGQNWDILSGLAAMAAAPLALHSHRSARVANILGLALLANVMRVALLSAPVPFGWHLPSPLLVAYHLPYAFIGPICVGGALFGHIVLTRALWAKRSSQH